MLFWNGNDYQNDKFIYNYFIQNVFFFMNIILIIAELAY